MQSLMFFSNFLLKRNNKINGRVQLAGVNVWAIISSAGTRITINNFLIHLLGNEDKHFSEISYCCSGKYEAAVF